MILANDVFNIFDQNLIKFNNNKSEELNVNYLKAVDVLIYFIQSVGKD